MLRVGSQHDGAASSLKALASSFAVAGLILALGWLVHYRTELDTERRLLAEQEKVVREQKYLVQSMLDDLASSANLLAYISADQLERNPNDTVLTRNLLRDEHLAFLRSRGTFEQLQIVRPSGERVLRIERVSRGVGAYTFEDVSVNNDFAPASEPWLPELLENASRKRRFFSASSQLPEEAASIPAWCAWVRRSTPASPALRSPLSSSIIPSTASSSASPPRIPAGTAPPIWRIPPVAGSATRTTPARLPGWEASSGTTPACR